MEVSVTSKTGSQPFTGEYRLAVENFGPISRASVALRPLTVFIGPSNTGKSYLSILMYALHQCFGSGVGPPYSYARRVRYRHVPISRRLADSNGLGLAEMEEFRSWLAKQFRENIQSSPEGEAVNSSPLDPLPEQVASYIRTIVEQAQGFENHLEMHIGRCFGVDNPHELIRRSKSRIATRVDLSIPRKDSAGIVRYELQLRKSGMKFAGVIGGVEPLSYDIDALDAFDGYEDLDQISDSYLKRVLDSMATSAFTSLFHPLSRNAYYLPADRTGVMHSHQVVVSTLVQNATAAGIRPFGNTPILSGVLADFLSELIEMSGPQLRNRRGHFEDLATRLEENVLRGGVRMESTQTGYPSFTYRPDGWNENLPLMRASSMVSELAPVALYLRHLVRKGDVLIIEEPESHLHPAMQVAFTRELAAAVLAGIRVIVTTHSEWLLEELANLVRLSQIPDSERQGLAGGKVALRSDQVGAWLFTPSKRSRGSTVTEIDIDNSGLYPSGFNDVAVALHNDWAEIASRIEND